VLDIAAFLVQVCCSWTQPSHGPCPHELCERLEVGGRGEALSVPLLGRRMCWGRVDRRKGRTGGRRTERRKWKAVGEW